MSGFGGGKANIEKEEADRQALTSIESLELLGADTTKLVTKNDSEIIYTSKGELIRVT